MQAHLAEVTPPGIEIELLEHHGGLPWKADVGGRLFEAAATALEKAFGTRPVLAGEGGSIPIVVEFERILGAPDPCPFLEGRARFGPERSRRA